MALRLGKLCGNGPELWLALQTRYDLERLRREKAAEINAIPTLQAAASDNRSEDDPRSPWTGFPGPSAMPHARMICGIRPAIRSNSACSIRRSVNMDSLRRGNVSVFGATLDHGASRGQRFRSAEASRRAAERRPSRRWPT